MCELWPLLTWDKPRLFSEAGDGWRAAVRGEGRDGIAVRGEGRDGIAVRGEGRDGIQQTRYPADTVSKTRHVKQSLGLPLKFKLRDSPRNPKHQLDASLALSCL